VPGILEEAHDDLGPDCVCAWIQTPGGAGSWGIRVQVSLPAPERLADLADQLQEWEIDELAAAGRSATWPQCPQHPGTHPLAPQARGGQATWCCPASGRSLASPERCSCVNRGGSRPAACSAFPKVSSPCGQLDWLSLRRDHRDHEGDHRPRRATLRGQHKQRRRTTAMVRAFRDLLQAHALGGEPGLHAGGGCWACLKLACVAMHNRLLTGLDAAGTLAHDARPPRWLHTFSIASAPGSSVMGESVRPGFRICAQGFSGRGYAPNS